MNVHSGRNSPMSSSEGLSGSSSPRVLKLAHVPTPPHQQRSLSMNSIGSNHSTLHRSMSITSLLPRNSIVLLDDNFIRPTRNNSTTSLMSLAPIASPNDSTKDTYAHRLSRVRVKSASAIAVVSDDDLESEHTTSRFKWRRRSSDKVLKPLFLSSLKRDFKFKYDSTWLPQLSLALLPGKDLDDPAPSPLSVSTDHNLHQHIMPAGHLHHHASDTELDALPPPRALSGKKVRTSSITQSIFLKKRLLLSKDIQLELLGAHNTHTATAAAMNEDSQFPPLLLPVSLPMPLPMSLPSLIPNYLQLNVAPPSKSPSPPLAGLSSSLREASGLRQKNKLITELNRKWNKACFLDERRLAGERPQTNSKKRLRSELASSSDSYTASH